MNARPLPPIRPEYVVPLVPPGAPASTVIDDAPPPLRRALQHTWLRKSLLLLLLAGLWEALARWQDNDLLQTARAFAAGMLSGELPGYVAASLAVLVQGYALGVAGALVLTSLAIGSRVGRDLLEP